MSQRRVAGWAALALFDGATPLRVEPALFAAMLSGWRRQQESRRLNPSIVGARERAVRRFAAFTGARPWCWRPEQVQTWTASGGWAQTIAALTGTFKAARVRTREPGDPEGPVGQRAGHWVWEDVPPSVTITAAGYGTTDLEVMLR